MITNISQNGIDLIKKWEGCRLKAYRCPAGVLTIGYGHTKGVKEGQTITQSEAEELLKQDLQKYVDHVRYYDEKCSYNFNQNEFDALCSFAFNIGSLNGITNNGKRTKFQIGCKIKSYVYAGGKKMQGLINRRTEEYNLYMKSEVNIVSEYEVGSIYKIVASALNVRKAPTVTADKALKTSYKKDKEVKVYEVQRDTDGNTWLRVSEKEYWIAAIYQGHVYVK